MKYIGKNYDHDLQDLIGEEVKIIKPTKDNYDAKLILIQFDKKHWGHLGLHNASSSGKKLPASSCYWVLPEDLK